MSKDKADVTSHRKTSKTHNGAPPSTTKLSRTRSDEVKKDREPSSDRNNIKKTTSRLSTGEKRSDSLNSRTKPVSNSSSRISTDRSGIKPSPKGSSDTKISSRTSVSKLTPKPASLTKNSVGSSKNIVTSKSNVASSKNSAAILKNTSKGTKSSSRDVTSHRVTKEQYFPKKYPFSSYLHEEESVRTDNSTNGGSKNDLAQKQSLENNLHEQKKRRSDGKTTVDTLKASPKIYSSHQSEGNNSRASTKSREASKVSPKVSSTRRSNEKESKNPRRELKPSSKTSKDHQHPSTERQNYSSSYEGLKKDNRENAGREQKPSSKTSKERHQQSSSEKSNHSPYDEPEKGKMASSSHRTSSSKQEANQDAESPPKLSRERTMTRILSPSEVQVVKNIVKVKTQSVLTGLSAKEGHTRPGTATVRKHDTPTPLDPSNLDGGTTSLDLTTSSLENTHNYLNPEKDQNLSLNSGKNAASDNYSEGTGGYDYDDDFDSYESDFEAYSSRNSSEESSLSSNGSRVDSPEESKSRAGSSASIQTDSSSSSSNKTDQKQIANSANSANSAGNEEERKLDSGNYDLPDQKHKQILDKIKEAIEKENFDLSKHVLKTEAVSNLASLSDEGFEDGSKSSLFSNGFINFSNARKKQQQKKLNLKSKKRGDDLMNMIRLDSVYYSLFDMKSITYEEFMRSYGRTGTIQMSTQTGDDDIDEEIQTENILLVDKSTQYPFRFSKTEPHLNPATSTSQHETALNSTALNHQNLEKFLLSSGRLILTILKQSTTSKNQQLTSTSEEKLPFSDGYFDINFTEVPFLKNRTVTGLSYSKYSALLTVHESNIHMDMSQDNQLLSRATICVWNLLEPNYPQKTLVSAGEVTKACFDCNHGYLVFAGVSDGTLSVWDLREPSELHRAVFDENTDQSFVMRAATYTTVSTIDAERCTSKMIAIQCYSTEKMEDVAGIDDQKNISGIQVCSLDEVGTVIIWSVIQKQPSPELLSEDQGVIPWGCVILVQGLVISLQKMNPNLKELQCFDLQFSSFDPNHLFVASNYGVLHCLTSGMKPKPKLYSSADKCAVSCVEISPFSAVHFLTGCENGNIKLHSRFYEKQLMTLCCLEENDKPEGKIQLIEWSNSRPCVFFVKDSSNYVHIWDLTSSDMYPVYSIKFREEISDVKLSPVLQNKSVNNPCYMAIASKKYGVRLHIVSKEFCNLTPERYKTELKIFLNYANRL